MIKHERFSQIALRDASIDIDRADNWRADAYIIYLVPFFLVYQILSKRSNSTKITLEVAVNQTTLSNLSSSQAIIPVS